MLVQYLGICKSYTDTASKKQQQKLFKIQFSAQQVEHLFKMMRKMFRLACSCNQVHTSFIVTQKAQGFLSNDYFSHTL